MGLQELCSSSSDDAEQLDTCMDPLTVPALVFSPFINTGNILSSGL